MKEGHIDWENGTVCIPDSKMPNRVTEVPRTDIAINALRGQLANSDPGPILLP